MSIIENTPIIAFMILICAMFVGDVVSYKTKAYIPALLIFLLLFLAGVWSGFLPKKIIEIPGFTASFANYVILMFLVDMGSSISMRQFVEQWKTVIVSLCTLAGAAIIILTIGKAIYGADTAIIAAPTVAGGFVAVLQMTQAAKNAGKEYLMLLPALIFVLHSFPAYLAFPLSLKKEGNRLLTDFREGRVKLATTAAKSNEVVEVKLVDKIPQSVKTSAFYLSSLAAFAVLAFFTSKFLNNILAPTVFGLVFGILGKHFGLLEEGSMRKSNSSGYLMFGSVISIFAGLSATNPNDILAVLASLLVLILLGVLGISIGSIASGKLLGLSTPFSLAIGLNSLLGFPMNFMLTTEAVNSIAQNDAEKEYLTQEILPSMLVAGFVCVTIGSTIFASIMANYL